MSVHKNKCPSLQESRKKEQKLLRLDSFPPQFLNGPKSTVWLGLIISYFSVWDGIFKIQVLLSDSVNFLGQQIFGLSQFGLLTRDLHSSFWNLNRQTSKWGEIIDEFIQYWVHNTWFNQKFSFFGFPKCFKSLEILLLNFSFTKMILVSRY